MNTNKQQLIKENDDGALLRAAGKGYVEVVKELLAVRTHEGQEAGSNVYPENDSAMQLPSVSGRTRTTDTLLTRTFVRKMAP